MSNGKPSDPKGSGSPKSLGFLASIRIAWNAPLKVDPVGVALGIGHEDSYRPREGEPSTSPAQPAPTQPINIPSADAKRTEPRATRANSAPNAVWRGSLPPNSFGTQPYRTPQMQPITKLSGSNRAQTPHGLGPSAAPYGDPPLLNLPATGANNQDMSTLSSAYRDNIRRRVVGTTVNAGEVNTNHVAREKSRPKLPHNVVGN